MTKKLFWIKERSNPQLKKPYYVACGQLSKKDAAAKEKAEYGDNTMLPFATQAEYDAAIAKLKADGFTVQS